MKGEGAMGSNGQSMESSEMRTRRLRKGMENELGALLSRDKEVIEEIDRKYARVGSSIVLLTVIAASSAIAFSAYQLYLQFHIGLGLRSVPYIAAIVASIMVSSAVVCAVIYNAPYLGRIRMEAAEKVIYMKVDDFLSISNMSYIYPKMEVTT